MSVVATAPKTGTLSLEGAGLLVPTLQSETLPIKRIETAPCTQACPAGINVKAYVSMVAERRFADALEMVRRRCPLPGICGRVCDHPCETACTRGRFDEPVAIRALKRFVADMEEEFPKLDVPQQRKSSARVAVIGSGPAGLTAAFDLAMAGYPVTVFESEAQPGGMLRYGITSYRLPRDVLDAEINHLVQAGIDIQTGRRLGGDLELDGLLSDGYKAVLLAVGAQKGRSLRVPGEDECPEVEDALAFLRRVNDGDYTPVKGKAVVIGGGSTAVEAARTALRLGASSCEILYRRYREELLAGDLEIKDAESEGINFRFLVTPTRVVSEGGRLKGLECVKIGLGEPDASGRRGPIVIPGSEFLVETDRVLAAVGQEADLSFVPPKSELLEGRWLAINPNTLMAPRAGVFAAGDVVTGPATLIKAIDAGHKAAESIRHYIEDGKPGFEEEPPHLRRPAEYELPDLPPVEAKRLWPATVPPKPGREFEEVEQVFTAEQAVEEAKRCLRCGPCDACRVCAPSCRRRYVMLSTPKEDGAPSGPTAFVRVPGNVAMGLSADEPTSGWLLPVIRPGALGEVDTSIGMPIDLLPGRVYVNEARCRGCGQCVDVCPFDALSLSNGRNREPKARLEPALCRGCNLCTAVCPTDAIIAGALSSDWWESRLRDIFETTSSAKAAKPPYVVLACERRAGVIEPMLGERGARTEVIRFRCTGQIDAGMLLELYRRGAGRILVAGCQSERCRFGSGAELAAEQVERARSTLRSLGGDADRITCDWSKSLADDSLEQPLKSITESTRKRSGPKPRSEMNRR